MLLLLFSESGGAVIACAGCGRGCCFRKSCKGANEESECGGDKEGRGEVTECTDRSTVGGIRVGESKVNSSDLQRAGPTAGMRAAGWRLRGPECMRSQCQWTKCRYLSRPSRTRPDCASGHSELSCVCMRRASSIAYRVHSAISASHTIWHAPDLGGHCVNARGACCNYTKLLLLLHAYIALCNAMLAQGVRGHSIVVRRMVVSTS